MQDHRFNSLPVGLDILFPNILDTLEFSQLCYYTPQVTRSSIPPGQKRLSSSGWTVSEIPHSGWAAPKKKGNNSQGPVRDGTEFLQAGFVTTSCVQRALSRNKNNRRDFKSCKKLDQMISTLVTLKNQKGRTIFIRFKYVILFRGGKIKFPCQSVSRLSF